MAQLTYDARAVSPSKPLIWFSPQMGWLRRTCLDYSIQAPVCSTFLLTLAYFLIFQVCPFINSWLYNLNPQVANELMSKWWRWEGTEILQEKAQPSFTLHLCPYLTLCFSQIETPFIFWTRMAPTITILMTSAATNWGSPVHTKPRGNHPVCPSR